MLFVGWAIATLSVALGYTSYMPDSYAGRRTLLLMANIVVGVGMGILMPTCQTYVSEIAPIKIRGMLRGIYTFVLVSPTCRDQEKPGPVLNAPADLFSSQIHSSSARPSPLVSSSLALLPNATYFLIQAGMNLAQSLEINQIGVSLGLPCILISYYTMQRFGRRAIILASMIATTVLFVGMGVAGLYPQDKGALK